MPFRKHSSVVIFHHISSIKQEEDVLVAQLLFQERVNKHEIEINTAFISVLNLLGVNVLMLKPLKLNFHSAYNLYLAISYGKTSIRLKKKKKQVLKPFSASLFPVSLPFFVLGDL